MWRKTNEAKPSSEASKTPAPAPVAPKETSQAPASDKSSFDKSSFDKSTTASAPPVASPAPPATQPPVQAASVPVVAQKPPVSSPLSSTSANGGSSTISAGLRIKGEITGTSDLVIDGETQGKVRLTSGRITVGPKGKVNADIDAREIVINGTVQGNLKATESVRLGPNSHVEGSILTPRIGIDDGARLHGNVEMTRVGETAAPASEAPKPMAAVRAASASTREE